MSPYEQPELATRASASAMDVVVGTSAWALETAAGLGQRAGRIIGWAVRSSPNLPVPGPAARLVTGLGQRGLTARAAVLRDASHLLDVLVPMVVDAVLGRMDITAVVREHVDVAAIVATVDLDAVVATVDLDAAVAGVDLDAVAARLDVESIIDRLDLTAIVRERVDLDLIVSQVDLDAVVARLDMDSIVRRLDLVAIATEVINEIDLPEIIRESTGSVASETIRGVRMQSIAGDEAIGRAVDRLLRRRGRRSVQAPGTSSSNGDAPGADPLEVSEPLVPGLEPVAPDDIPDQRSATTATTPRPP